MAIQVDKNGKESFVTKLNDGATIKFDTPPEGSTYYIVDGMCYIQVYLWAAMQLKLVYGK